jgi:cell wall-associated NlpC family hydrolase
VALTASVGAFSVQPASAQTATAAKAATATVTTTAVTASTKTVKKKLSKAALQQSKARRAISTAKKHIGDPYRWGATGPHAFDCSGLVKYAWRKAGVKLPRTTYSMRKAVKKKVSWGHFKIGDLIFTSGGGHVGMYVGHGKMIHSPHSGSRVRIDKLNSYRKQTFVGAVRPGL